MFMNRVLLIAFLIIAITIFPVSALKVGIYDNPPHVFVENGEVKGFYIDILKLLPKRKDGSSIMSTIAFPICWISWKEGR